MDVFKNKYITLSYFNIFFFNSITYFGLHYPQLFVMTMPFLYLYTNIILFLYAYFSYDHHYMNSWYSLYIQEEDSSSEKDESEYPDEFSDEDSENDKEKKE